MRDFFLSSSYTLRPFLSFGLSSRVNRATYISFALISKVDISAYHDFALLSSILDISGDFKLTSSFSYSARMDMQLISSFREGDTRRDMGLSSSVGYRIFSDMGIASRVVSPGIKSFFIKSSFVQTDRMSHSLKSLVLRGGRRDFYLHSTLRISGLDDYLDYSMESLYLEIPAQSLPEIASLGSVYSPPLRIELQTGAVAGIISPVFYMSTAAGLSNLEKVITTRLYVTVFQNYNLPPIFSNVVYGSCLTSSSLAEGQYPLCRIVAEESRLESFKSNMIGFSFDPNVVDFIDRDTSAFTLEIKSLTPHAAVWKETFVNYSLLARNKFVRGRKFRDLIQIKKEIIDNTGPILPLVAMFVPLDIINIFQVESGVNGWVFEHNPFVDKRNILDSNYISIMSIPKKDSGVRLIESIYSGTVQCDHLSLSVFQIGRTGCVVDQGDYSCVLYENNTTMKASPIAKEAAKISDSAFVGIIGDYPVLIVEDGASVDMGCSMWGCVATLYPALSETAASVTFDLSYVCNIVVSPGVDLMLIPFGKISVDKEARGALGRSVSKLVEIRMPTVLEHTGGVAVSAHMSVKIDEDLGAVISRRINLSIEGEDLGMFLSEEILFEVVL